ncbi:MAG TPA: hypothetical protein VHM90_20120, partial [Phycisphaerae bacterium]|nr:hypothetical protein [Phycisphaerae bacterium]
MLPTYLLPKISPHACKLYFVLLAHLKPGKDAPIATVSMNSLAADSALSPRTCCRALTELCDLALLRRLPFAYHQIHSYLFLPIPDPPAQATHTAS